MQLVPAGTPDPSPFIFDSSLYTMAGMMVSVRLLMGNSPRCLIVVLTMFTPMASAKRQTYINRIIQQAICMRQ